MDISFSDRSKWKRAAPFIHVHNSQMKCVIPYLLVSDSCHPPEACGMLGNLKRVSLGRKRGERGGRGQEMGKGRSSFLLLAFWLDLDRSSPIAREAIKRMKRNSCMSVLFCYTTSLKELVSRDRGRGYDSHKIAP